MNAKELEKILIEKMEKGVYHEKMKLPTEDQLIEQYDVTRYCVRQVIERLVTYGLVYQVQGSGMYVRELNRKDYLTLSSTKGISNEFPNKKVTTKVIKMEVVDADADMAELMKCKIGTKIYKLCRLRLVDGKPFAIEYTNYDKELVPYLSKEIAEHSIYDYLRNDLKLNIGFADKIIFARKLTKKEAELLHLQAGDPTIVFRDVGYLKNGKVFNASTVVYQYEDAQFFNLAMFK